MIEILYEKSPASYYRGGALSSTHRFFLAESLFSVSGNRRCIFLWYLAEKLKIIAPLQMVPGRFGPSRYKVYYAGYIKKKCAIRCHPGDRGGYRRGLCLLGGGHQSRRQPQCPGRGQRQGDQLPGVSAELRTGGGILQAAVRGAVAAGVHRQHRPEAAGPQPADPVGTAAPGSGENRRAGQSRGCAAADQGDGRISGERPVQP